MTTNDENQTPWHKRRLRGGTWTDAAAQAAPPRADRTVPVKMTAEELAEFDATVARLGIKRNRALRIAARRIAGFIEADPDTLALLKDMSAQLSGIARNVNQIAKAANRTRDPDFLAFMEDRRDLGKQLARVEDLLRQFMDTAQRRADGEARLRREMQP